MSSITGLGIREKTKSSFQSKGKDGRSQSTSQPAPSSLTGLGLRSKVGIGKKSPLDQANEHTSRPLHTLKDPSAFGPPPKNVNYHGGVALPNQITPDRVGLGAPLSRAQLQAEREAEDAQIEAEEAAQAIKQPSPYRSDTSGLSTSHLPPPPNRRDGADGRTPPALPAARGKPPGLPPRLPPRQNSSSLPSTPSAHSFTPEEPDAHRGILNQGALNRLGNAGVSVPEFGVGSQNHPPLSPRSPGLSSRETPLSPAAINNPQLNELQSRFSRLSTSKAESPNQGTTFAEKQAALKTVSAFRNDPSSVSLNDAKSAVGTANNFRDRHGEQVKSGWQSANKLNTQYGIANKVGAYGQPSQDQPTSPQIEMRDNTLAPSTAPQVGGLGKKKPPPPPIKKSQLSGGLVGGSPVPPPIPLASKPKPPLFRAPESNASDDNRSHELDLNLSSLWFAKSPVILPPSIVGTQGKKIHASSSGWSSSGARKTHSYTAIVQENATLSRHIVDLTWDASNPGVTVKARQKYIPPPRKLSWNELEAYRQSYSDAVATWCESNIGRQVGNGECWTLANESLKAVAENCKSYGTEPCMASQSLVHGALIYSFLPAVSHNAEPQGSILETGVARGDIIQILKAVFKSRDGRRSQFAGDPDHTAVVTRVEANGVLRVVEANAGGTKNVREGSYDMSEMVSGEVRIFRAVGQSWVGELDPTW